jgi:hypothetical protein
MSKKILMLVAGMFAIFIMATPAHAAESTVNDDLLVEKAMPISVTGEKTNGSGTAVDYTYSGEKEFYTIVTADDTTYYLIIDNEKEQSNVYFLREINEGELSIKNNVPISEIEKDPTPDPIPTPQPTPEKKPKVNNNLMLILVAFVGVAGAGYYFKVYKPKQMKKDEANTDAEEFEEDYEELEYEDEMIETDENEG